MRFPSTSPRSRLGVGTRAVAVATLLCLAACGSTQPETGGPQATGPGDTPQVDTTPSPTPAPTTAAAVTGPLTTADHVWHYTNQNGYGYDLSIAMGAAEHYVPGMVLSDAQDRKIGSSCSIDPRTDAVIPVRLTVTATTSQFDTTVSVRTILTAVSSASSTSKVDYHGAGTAPKRDDDRVSVEKYYAGGPECAQMSSVNTWGSGQPKAITVKWEKPLSPGDSISHRFVIVIKDYYSPATPEGDSAYLEAVGLRPMMGGDMSDQANVYSEPKDELDGRYSRTVLSLSGQVVTNPSSR